MAVKNGERTRKELCRFVYTDSMSRSGTGQRQDPNRADRTFYCFFPGEYAIIINNLSVLNQALIVSNSGTMHFLSAELTPRSIKAPHRIETEDSLLIECVLMTRSFHRRSPFTIFRRTKETDDATSRFVRTSYQ